MRITSPNSAASAAHWLNYNQPHTEPILAQSTEVTHRLCEDLPHDSVYKFLVENAVDKI